MQSTSPLNPYTNPDGALERRNTVLDTLIEYLPDEADESAPPSRAAGGAPPARSAATGLYSRGRPRVLLRVRPVISRAPGLSKEDVARNGYLIRTTLDPKVQDSVKSAIEKFADPTPTVSQA